MVENGWYVCPYCGQKLFVVDSVAHADGIKIKCKGKLPNGEKCGKIVSVKI